MEFEGRHGINIEEIGDGDGANIGSLHGVVIWVGSGFNYQCSYLRGASVGFILNLCSLSELGPGSFPLLMHYVSKQE